MNRIEKLQEMLAENPKDCFLRHALALEMVKMGEDTKAQKIFESILTDEPQYIASYYQLAKLLERLNNKEKAIEYYEKGMQEAKAAKDTRTYNELKSAYEELIY
jgi:Tfp pilus assembly protein PilF